MFVLGSFAGVAMAHNLAMGGVPDKPGAPGGPGTWGMAAVVVGMTSSLAWILLSGDTFSKVYGLSADLAPAPFSQPGIVTIPLGFLTLVVVSLLTRGKNSSP